MFGAVAAGATALFGALAPLVGIIALVGAAFIVKLSDYYRFLQISYSLTDTGRVIRKINPKRIVDMRRKLKALSIKVKNGERTQEEVENMFRSWMGG